MQIAGVETGGKNKGSVIEKTELEKAEAAIRLGVHDHEAFAGKSLTLNNVALGSVTASDVGPKLNGLYENRSYQATGSAEVWKRDKESDTVAQPVWHTFEIKFHDVLDVNDMPDLKIDTLKVD